MMMSRLFLLLATLSFTANVYANSSSCAEAYETASGEYAGQVAAFENGALSGGVVAGVGGIGAGICFFTAPTVVPCVVVGALGLTAYGYRREQLAALESLEQRHKLNVLYKSIKSGTEKDSELVRNFIHELGVDEAREEEAFSKVAWLMESGVLCDRGVASTGYDGLERLLASPFLF